MWATLSEIDDEARIVINQVTDYVELESGWRRTERQALLGIAQEFVDLLRAGGLSPQGFAARAVAVGLDPERPITILAFAHDIGEVAAALEAVATQPSGSPARCTTCPTPKSCRGRASSVAPRSSSRRMPARPARR